MIKIIIAIATSVSNHTVLKKSYLLYISFTQSAWTFKEYQYQYFTFNLKDSRLSGCFDSTGTKSHILGLK